MKFHFWPCSLLLLLFCVSSRAQNNLSASTGSPSGNTRFLWFTGHWNPTKKNIFIVDKDSAGRGGGTITIHPGGKITTSGKEEDEWNKKIEEGIQQMDKWVAQLTSPANNVNPDSYELNQLLLPDAREQQQLFNDYKIDPDQDLLSPDDRPGKSPTGNQNPSSPASNSSQSGDANSIQSAAALCEKVKADYKEVLSYYSANKKYNDANLQVPPPPEFEYSCYACDSNMRKVYDTTIEHYVRDFVHPEQELVRKGMAILKQLGEAGLNKPVIPETYAELFSKSGPCNYIGYDELTDAVMGIAQHLYWRAEKLVTKYQKRFKAAEAVTRTYLSVARDYILISALKGTGQSNPEDQYFPILAGMIYQNFYFYFDKLKHNDWKQVGNLTYMLSLCRNSSLLGSNSADYDFDKNLAKIAEVFNGFELTVEMDVKTGKEKGYWISHLKGRCKVGPKFSRDSNQCYKWVVMDESSKDGFGFYNFKQDQDFDCDLITNQIVVPNGAPVYIGTKKYTNRLEGLKMDFCNPGKDTIIFSRFLPNPKNNGLWKLPYGPPQPMGITGEEYFADYQTRKEYAKSGKAKEESDAFQKKNEEMVDEMKKLASRMKSDTGAKRMEDYQKIMAMSKKTASSAADNGVLAKMLFIDFEIPVQDNSSVLVDQTFEGAKINPKFSQVIVYANFKIHLENKSNSAKKN